MTIAARFVLKALERLSVGRLTLHLPDGTTAASAAEGATPHAELHVRDWRFFRRVLLDGDIGFAEAYMEGFCDSPDLPGLIALLAENEKSLGRMAHTNVAARPAAEAPPLAAPQLAHAARARTSTPTTISATSSTGCGSTRR